MGSDLRIQLETIIGYYQKWRKYKYINLNILKFENPPALISGYNIPWEMYKFTSVLASFIISKEGENRWKNLQPRIETSSLASPGSD